MVEVGESSVTLDRRVKIPMYAHGGIAEVWLVDLEEDGVTVYLDPTPVGFRAIRTVHRGEKLVPVSFPDREIAVDDILG